MRHAEHVMGTVVSFDVRGGGAAGMADACAILQSADAVFSTWQPDSPMSRIRRNELSVGEAPAEIAWSKTICATGDERSRRDVEGWVAHIRPWRRASFKTRPPSSPATQRTH